MMRKTIYCVTVLTLWSSSARVFSQTGSTISGKVINRTTQQEVKADWVVLAKTGQGLQTLRQLDNVSAYEFSDVPVLAQAPYLIRAYYEGVVYSQNLLIRENKNYRVDVKVYDVTEKWDNMSVRIPHTIIARNGDRLTIEQTFEVLNTGKFTFISSDTKKPTFRFVNPPGSRMEGATTSYENSMPLPAAPIEYQGAWGINVPIKPGASQFQITYSADYSANAFELTNQWLYDISEYNIFVSPKDIRVSSDRLAHLHDEKLEADNFAIYQAKNLKANESLSVRLSGGGLRNRPQGNNTENEDAPVTAVSTAIQKNVFVLIPFFLSVLILILYFGLSRKLNNKDHENDWNRQQDVLARQIADLDDSFEGKNNNDGYQKRRTELKSQLKKVIAKIHKKDL